MTDETKNEPLAETNLTNEAGLKLIRETPSMKAKRQREEEAAAIEADAKAKAAQIVADAEAEAAAEAAQRALEAGGNEKPAKITKAVAKRLAEPAAKKVARLERSIADAEVKIAAKKLEVRGMAVEREAGDPEAIVSGGGTGSQGGRRAAGGGRVKSLLGAVMAGLVACSLFVSSAARAQMRSTPPGPMNDASGQFWGLEAAPQPDGGLAIITTPALGFAVQQIGGTVVAAEVFQTAISASTSRHGCIVQNLSPANEYVTVSTPRRLLRRGSSCLTASISA